MVATCIASICAWTWMGTQSAQNWLLLVNLVFVGIYVVLTGKLVRWQRKQWALDSRKQEWSELIGTLTDAFQKVELVVAPVPSRFALATSQAAARQAEARWALLKAAAVINDRLFILEVVEKEHIREDWREIEVMSDQLNPVQQGQISATTSTAGITDFQQKWVAFYRKLVRTAQADLGIVSREGAAR